MLASLSVFLMTVLVACTLTLLLLWACDADRAQIETIQTHQADRYTVTESASIFRLSWVDPDGWPTGVPRPARWASRCSTPWRPN